MSAREPVTEREQGLAEENQRLRIALRYAQMETAEPPPGAATEDQLREAFRRGMDHERNEWLRQNQKLEQRLHALVGTWVVEGPSPRIHRAAVRKVRNLMPLLADRLDREAKALGRGGR